ncbi:unnamed protein product [Oncorhynchus mykiss]|uniref:CYRIA/CYRIB Rac1 binding domain-containing protein n=1 Tax=Oncorhynchus mykiss TaxID=8022 RepID=A0A060YVN0_ONCMY|nr:unnamed protein product [Oncorhynchus mykiss]
MNIFYFPKLWIVFSKFPETRAPELYFGSFLSSPFFLSFFSSFVVIFLTFFFSPSSSVVIFLTFFLFSPSSSVVIFLTFFFSPSSSVVIFLTFFFFSSSSSVVIFLSFSRPSRTQVICSYRRRPGTQSAPWWPSSNASTSSPSDWMTNPAIQNDFSYYRRTISRNRLNNQQLEAENEVNNEMANRMSLFYAEATPMLKTLSNATTKFVSENKTLPIEDTTDCLSTMACVCRVMLETP